MASSYHPSTRSRRELHVMVVCEWDTSRKYRVILRGNLEKLSVPQLKEYISARTGVPPREQVLIFEGRAIRPDRTVGSLGLYPDAHITLRHEGRRAPSPKVPHPPPSARPSTPPPQPHPPHAKYYSPSESDVESRQFSSRASASTVQAGHGAAVAGGRLAHYPIPVAEPGPPEGVPQRDHVGRMRQMQEEVQRLEGALVPNPSFVCEAAAGRNDLHAIQERRALEEEAAMAERVEALRAQVCGAALPESYDERRERMLGPSRMELMEEVRLLRLQRDEALGTRTAQDALIRAQRVELDEIRITLNGQRNVIQSQRPFVMAAAPEGSARRTSPRRHGVSR